MFVRTSDDGVVVVVPSRRQSDRADHFVAEGRTSIGGVIAVVSSRRQSDRAGHFVVGGGGGVVVAAGGGHNFYLGKFYRLHRP